MKRAFFIGVVCSVAMLVLAACAMDQPYPDKGNRCYARDRDGRIWSASAFRNACHEALQKCNRWHYERGIRHYRCEVE